MTINIIAVGDEQTSAKGNKYRRVTTDMYKDVAVFPTFTGYASLAVGPVEGVIKEKEYNGNKSYTLESGNLGPKPASFGGIQKNMERKEQGIAKFQDNKEAGIKTSGTARDATLITLELSSIRTQLGNPFTELELHQKWQEVRKWLIENWDENLNQPPF